MLFHRHLKKYRTCNNVMKIFTHRIFSKVFEHKEEVGFYISVNQQTL